MRKLALFAAGFAVLAGSGVARAQMPPGGPSGGPGAEQHDMGPRGPGGGPGEGMERRHWHHGGGAAGFHFQKGDMEIGIKCSNRESMQACVAAAATLLDKLNPAARTP